MSIEQDQAIDLIEPSQMQDERYRIVPALGAWRHVGTAIAVLAIGGSFYSLLLNPRWGWDVWAKNFLSEPILSSLFRTLWLTAAAAILGFILGGALAFARLSRSRLLSGLAWAYIWLLRSIPLIVLLLVLNNIAYLYPTIVLGVPFTGIDFAEFPTSDTINVYVVAVIGLSLNEAAFAAEIIRGGILSVDVGQREAAAALGLSKARESLHIILPQAMRAIVPPAFNEVINLAKSTSVLYILALPELFYTVQVIYRRNLEVIPLLMVATVWYLVILTILSAFQAVLERYFGRGSTRNTGGPILPFWPTSQRVAPAAIAQTVAHTSRKAEGAPVDIRSVSRRFGSFVAIDGVSLHVEPGEVVALIGPSGAGKSTLLRMINHLERPDEGLITIAGEPIGYRREGNTLYELKEREVRQRRCDVGMVFQNFNLFPHLTAIENIMEAPVALGRADSKTAEQQAWELLARVGLSEKGNAYPRQLSGGQQQRVAIARALALRPSVLLFDEPTSALDPELVGEVLDVMRDLASSGTTMVVVTHEIGFAREVADKVVFMEQGKVLEVARPAEFFAAPRSPRAAEFLSKVL